MYIDTRTKKITNNQINLSKFNLTKRIKNILNSFINSLVF